MFNLIKSVAKHSMIYGISDFLSRAIGFIMIPLYTHYLNPSDYGTLELLDLTSYFIGLFMAMGIAQSVVRFYYEYTDQVKRDQVISVAMITLWVACAAVLIILISLSRQFSLLLFKKEDLYNLFNIIFISTVIGLSNEIPQALLRIEEKSLTYVTISISKLLLNLSLNIFFLTKLHIGVIGILYSGLISSSLMGIYLTTITVRRLKFSYSFSMLKSMLAYGIPMMWSWFGMFVLNFGDRFFLQRLTTLSDVGIYSLAYKFGFLPNIIVLNPFLMIWAPKRFSLVNEPNAKEIYSTIFTYFLFAELLVGLGLATLIKEVITLVADPQYFEAYKYVGLILMAYIANGVGLYVQFGIHLAKKTKHLAYATILGAAINVVGNYFLIKLFGIWGAAISTFISFLFLLVYIYIPSQRLYHIPYEGKRVLHMVVVAAAIYTISLFCGFSNLFLSILVKTILVLTFPLILWLTGFFTDRELLKIKSISHTGYRYVIGKLARQKDYLSS